MQGRTATGRRPHRAHKALSLYSSYAWRERIGLISPSTNTTLEPEFWRMAPEGVSIQVARVQQAVRQGDLASYGHMADGIADAGTLLATAGVGPAQPFESLAIMRAAAHPAPHRCGACRHNLCQIRHRDRA